MTDRAAQLEQVARRMFFEELAPFVNTDENWQRHLLFYRSLPEMAPSMTKAFRLAEIALSLAEATREGVAKWHDGREAAANEYGLLASLHRACAAAIRATPITIGDAATQETDHD